MTYLKDMSINQNDYLPVSVRVTNFSTYIGDRFNKFICTYMVLQAHKSSCVVLESFRILFWQVYTTAYFCIFFVFLDEEARLMLNDYTNDTQTSRVNFNQKNLLFFFDRNSSELNLMANSSFRSIPLKC